MVEGAADAGRRIAGRYELTEELGRGGMGVVWLARDLRDGGVVAVKEVLLSPGLGAQERQSALARIRREGELAARIKHPSVIPVHGVVEDEGRPWVVMEYIQGASLQDVIDRQGPVRAEEAARIAGQMLVALQEAHSYGVVHRDIKPANILLSRDGRVILTDFGIATATGATRITHTGGVIGTTEYMAPERLERSEEPPASDLWSLAVTLFHAIEGYSPFRRETVGATVAAIIAQPVPATRASGPLASLLTSLMQRDPARRPTPGQALEFLHRQPPSPPTGAGTRMMTPATGSPVPQSQAEQAAPTTVAALRLTLIAAAIGYPVVWVAMIIVGRRDDPDAPLLLQLIVVVAVLAIVAAISGYMVHTAVRPDRLDSRPAKIRRKGAHSHAEPLTLTLLTGALWGVCAVTTVGLSGALFLLWTLIHLAIAVLLLMPPSLRYFRRPRQ